VQGVQSALADAEPACFWLQDSSAPAPAEALVGPVDTDLLVVGGGYTGLWAALLAKEAEPDRDVVLLEGRTAGWAASGRNGGFCDASLTHGLANGVERFAGELPELLDLGAANLAGIEATLSRHGIDAEWERTGSLTVATRPWQLEGLREEQELAARYGRTLEVLDRDELRAEVDSPTYLGGVWDASGAPWCTRRSSPGACAAPASTWGSGSTSRARCWHWTTRAGA
jgi:glycine/D-amino acid oxidase-like deaminating enzyme